MNRAMEEWRPIIDSKGYEVSSLGRVRRNCRVLKQRLLRGYAYVQIACPLKTKNCRVHGLVMAAFVGPRPDGLHVAHKDGNRTNNALPNLRYCTAIENRADDVANGTRPAGERHGSAKLTVQQVQEIRRRRGEKSQAKLAVEYGVNQTTIGGIQLGRLWSHV